jgi:hypothetical protein
MRAVSLLVAVKPLFGRISRSRSACLRRPTRHSPIRVSTTASGCFLLGQA